MYLKSGGGEAKKRCVPKIGGRGGEKTLCGVRGSEQKPYEGIFEPSDPGEPWGCPGMPSNSAEIRATIDTRPPIPVHRISKDP